jgi:hypothetical protein
MAVPDLTFRHVDRDVFTTPAHERKANPFDTRYRTASMHHHPDRGGSHAMMAYLNTARDHLLPEG